MTVHTPAESGATSAPLDTTDRPDAYIPRDRRWALHAGHDLPDRVSGSALFADISGFTPLTEALANELGPQRGAEELTANLGRVFHAVISELDAFDGNVIYFAGDAITCWIDGDDGLRACAAAAGMQEAIERTGRIVTPGGTEVQLAMKVAIAVGNARRFVVGDPDIQLIDVLAGRLMDELASAEHHAERGEIVLDESAMRALDGRVALGIARVDEATGRCCAPLRGVLVDVDSQPGREPDPLPDDQVRSWLLPAVYERMRTGRGEFLAELRPAVPLFVRFGGIDYDNDDDAIGKLDQFVRAAQRVMNGFGGNVLQLTLGDKGAYLYGVFGSPLAHEDDPARAASAALELIDLERTTAARDIQVGIAQGSLRSGTYGHAMRRTFSCLGDTVNLAARLMANAPAHHVLVTDGVREAAGETFIWEQLPDLRVKGKAQPVEVWGLSGSLERASRRKTRFELGLIGRRDELALLETGLERAVDGQGAVVGIAAEAGMGKSRLVAEFTRNARRRGHTVAFGECQAYGTKTPYFVWQEIWRRLFDLSDEDSRERQAELVEERLRAIDPSLVARAPLLSEVLGVSIPDSELTRGFDAKLRKASLEDLLSKCLRARAQASPFVVVLEDCHWIDELSRDLLQVLARSAAGLAVLFVLAYRPAAGSGGDLGLERHPGFTELVLDSMADEDIAELVRAKMANLRGGAADVADELVALIAARSDGNPFYVEELLNYVVANGVDPSDADAVEHLRLPESLHTLVLSRIDGAAEGPRRTMKVASVVGRVFPAPMLPGTYEELGDIDTVVRDLDALRVLDLVALDREAEQAWMFKHAVTQEVAYESLPYALRSLLHGRVGDYIERTEADLERVVPLLEHHFWRSEREDKKKEYLWKAAEAAQAAYANQAAVAYYERLVPILTDEECLKARLALGRAYELIGDWAKAADLDADALALAVELNDVGSQGWAKAALAEVSRKQGQFEAATRLLDEAAGHFADVGDDAGLGQVSHLAGTVAAQQGDLETAGTRYEESLVIRERLGDQAKMGALYSNLAIVAEYSGHLEASRRMAEQALAMRIAANDRWGTGVSLGNLGAIAVKEGRLDEARTRSEEALVVFREVGDPWMTANTENNLGNAARDLGDYPAAGTSYASSLRTFAGLDDRWALAILIEDVAALCAARGEHRDAVMLVGAASTLRAAIGASHSEAMEAELQERIRASLDALGPSKAAAARRRGESLSLPEAVEAASRACMVR